MYALGSFACCSRERYAMTSQQSRNWIPRWSSSHLDKCFREREKKRKKTANQKDPNSQADTHHFLPLVQFLRFKQRTSRIQFPKSRRQLMNQSHLSIICSLPARICCSRGRVGMQAGRAGSFGFGAPLHSAVYLPTTVLVLLYE